MPPLYAFDGAGPFDLAAAKRAGGIAVTVYIRGRPGGMAPADRARVNAARALGLGVSPNWEAAANFFDTCSLADAHWAGADALVAAQALGFPGDGSIACSYSFDFDTSGPRLKEMGQKLQACHDGAQRKLGAMGYGEQELIDYLAANKIGTPKHWLMMSTFGQTYNPASPNVCMVQGHDVAGNWIQSKAVPGSDINTVTDPHALGAWWTTGSPYAGGTPVTPAEIQAIAQAVWNMQYVHTDEATGKKNSKSRTFAQWLTNLPWALADLPKPMTAVELTAAIQAAGVALTDAQVAAIAAAVLAGAPPAPTGFTVESKVTQT